jgi:hypothetical protein
MKTNPFIQADLRLIRDCGHEIVVAVYNPGFTPRSIDAIESALVRADEVEALPCPACLARSDLKRLGGWEGVAKVARQLQGFKNRGRA